MRLHERISALDRLQQRPGFKIAASIVITLVMGIALVSYAVAAKAREVPSLSVPSAESAPTQAGAGGAPPAKPAIGPTIAGPEDTALETGVRVLHDVMATRRDPTSVAVTLGLAWAGMMVVVWLGLALTYLSLGLGIGGVLLIVRATGHGGAYVPVFAGMAALVAAFTALMRSVRLLYGSSTPVFAIARNVLIEATRMRVSLVFIILLIFLLATLPGLMDEGQPLRYRVQAFLQYATSGSFWLIAVLTVAFSCATVGFDQRDKTIWQTVTKPVRAWEYILGKWLGVVTFAAILLAVCSSGIFMFTEYLRGQPANGEKAAYVALADGAVAEDRFLLETQVLAARVEREPEPISFDREQYEKNVTAIADRMVAEQLSYLNEGPQRAQEELKIREKVRNDYAKAIQASYRAIPPGDRQVYTFTGLSQAKNSSRPLFLRFKVNAGSNPPDQRYRISFQFYGTDLSVREVGLGQSQTLPLLPSVVDEEGKAALLVVNGDAYQQRGNPETIAFPPGGLQLSYSEGSYGWNFLRVVSALWVKIAFLAMVGVFCATFMSFPVACLVSFAVFFAAEGAKYLSASLETFSTEDREGKVLVFNTIVAYIAQVVSQLFRVYADLKPTTRLAEGIKLSFGDVALGTGVLALWTLVLFLFAVLIFRRRELAVYSGH